jgi:hypothetical protein
MSDAHSELLHHFKHQRAHGRSGVAIVTTLDVSESERTSPAVRAIRTKIAALGTLSQSTAIAFNAAQAVVVTDENTSHEIVQSLIKIDGFLQGQSLGKLTAEVFHIPNDSQRIFATLGKSPKNEGLVLQLSPTVSEAREKDFDHLIDIERMLRAADLSNLTRERPVYDFSDMDNPTIVQSELVVDVSEIGRLASVNIKKRPWLFSEVTRVLDGRMMAHLLRDEMSGRNSISVNQHLKTVLSEQFTNFSDRFTAAPAPSLSIELDLAEMHAFPNDAVSALRRVREADFSVVVDCVPASYLTGDGEKLPAIEGQYKFDWRHSFPMDSKSFDAAEIRSAKGWRLEKLGVDRCVLLHCHTPTVIENALALGFTLLEGFEIASYLKTPRVIDSKP